MMELAWVQLNDEFGRDMAVAVDDLRQVREDPDGSGSWLVYRDGRELEIDESVSTVVSKITTLWDQYRARGAVQETVTKTAAYTATVSDYTILCDATGAAFTVTLPAVATVTGRIYVIKKIDSSGNAITIDGNASETIDGATTKSLSSQWQTLMIQSNGSAWYILAGGASA